MNSMSFIPPKPTQAQQATEADLLADAMEFLNQHPMRYVLKLGVYFVQKQDGSWMPVKPQNMKHHYPAWNVKGFPLAVTVSLNDRGWSFNDVTYSFRDDVPFDVLNLADRSGWLMPEAGEYHWLFDVLVQSLGGGKVENMQHIEHVIAYKYLHPSTYTLPCLVIHGEGGVGKNLVVDHVLPTIFDGQTLSAKAEHIIGQFNGLLKGKAVVMLDESENDRTCESALKHTLGRDKLTINEKGIQQYEVDNTPLYLISSNRTEGGVWLDRSQADRRFSVLHVKKGQPLQYWIARRQKWIDGDRQFLDEGDEAFARASQWMLDEGFAILKDRDQVARWLGHLLIEHGEKPQPLPLHGSDFNRLMDIQKPLWERMVEAVFGDPEFTHIERSVMYRGYRALGSSLGQKVLSDKKFNEKVRDWLERHQPDVEEGKVRQGPKKSSTVWYNTLAEDASRRQDNSDRYLGEQGYSDRWIGPEV